jgi:hypothetical protein
MTNHSDTFKGALGALGAANPVSAPNTLPHPSSLPNTTEAESDSEAETKCETESESFPILVAKATGKHLAKLLFAKYFSKSVDVVGAKSKPVMDTTGNLRKKYDRQLKENTTGNWQLEDTTGNWKTEKQQATGEWEIGWGANEKSVEATGGYNRQLENGKSVGGPTRNR